MTQDEMIEMAIEAEFVSRGKPSDEESELFVCTDKDIVCFAKLVAAKALVQRTWVGLTDDEMENTFIQCGGKWNGDYWEIEDADFHPFLRTIEAKLKDKNGYADSD